MFQKIHLNALNISCLLLCAMVGVSCTNNNDNDNNEVTPSPGTAEIASVSSGGATITVTLTLSTNVQILSAGVCWSPLTSPTTKDSVRTVDVSTARRFTVNLTTLTRNSTYHVRPFVELSTGTLYGTEITLKTTKGSPISVHTGEPYNPSSNSVMAGGGVDADSSGRTPSYSAKGFCWATHVGATVADSVWFDTSPNWWSFQTYLPRLKPDTKYYLRAFAADGGNFYYGSEFSFSTTGPFVYTLTTSEATHITGESAQIESQLKVASGWNPVIASGICFAVHPNPTILDSISSFDSGGSYYNVTWVLAGLQPNTAYYARLFYSFAGGDIAYGDEISFTSIGPTIFTVTTTASHNTSSYHFEGGFAIDGPGYARAVSFQLSNDPSFVNISPLIGFLTSDNHFEVTLDQRPPYMNAGFYVRACVMTDGFKNIYGNSVLLD